MTPAVTAHCVRGRVTLSSRVRLPTLLKVVIWLASSRLGDSSRLPSVVSCGIEMRYPIRLRASGG